MKMPRAIGSLAARSVLLIIAILFFAPTSSAAAKLDQVGHLMMGRRLLAAKEAALKGLEDVLLEPPLTKTTQQRRMMRYLPDLMGDSLDGYPRRVYVDVAQPGQAGSAGWFEKNYPKRQQEFEIVRVEMVSGGAAAGGMAEWLEGNVRENQYVVVKAEAEVVEEMMMFRGRALRLVDELFLECNHQGEKRKAYWECVALYGRLRDMGVAVHQWWG